MRRTMDLQGMIERLKNRSDSEKIGMIASHLGVVRGTSRGGDKVSEIQVEYDHENIINIINYIKNLNGIIDVIVEVNEGRLHVGEEIMAVAVAGDIRENVFPALIETVNRIKREASRKREYP
jgi:molybdopterin synthase catalytic subunit